MTDKHSASKDSQVDRQSITDFGDQWTRYTDNSGYYGSLGLFTDICAPLLTVEDVQRRVVADIGSGTGRIVNMLLDAGAARVVALEPSESFTVVAANTADRADRVEVIRGDGTAIPQDRHFDLVVSIGVLHQIANPAPAIEAPQRALRPGGAMFVWLYGREGKEAYVALAKPLRALTKQMPHRLLAALCHALDLISIAYTAATKILRLPMRDSRQNAYCRLGPDKRRLVISEARALLEDGGFANVRTQHRHGYSWSVVD